MAKGKIIRIYWQVLGGHVHTKVFTGTNIKNGTLGKAGELCMTADEFTAFRMLCNESVPGDDRLEFVEHEKTVTSRQTAVPVKQGYKE